MLSGLKDQGSESGGSRFVEQAVTFGAILIGFGLLAISLTAVLLRYGLLCFPGLSPFSW